MYRALIVEDEDLMREYLASRLQTLCPEWEVASVAADGIEATDRLARERYDAVITDIRMPGMDGLELARLIRQRNAELPILIITGYDEFDYARSAVRLNVFDYLLKPINEAELTAALSAMAAQLSQKRSMARANDNNANQNEDAALPAVKAQPISNLVQKAQDFLSEHYAEPISLTIVADELGVTAAYLSALFHREIGLSYSQALLKLRMEDAARRLTENPTVRVSDVGEAVGFPSGKHFIHVFGQFYHMTPGEYRAAKKR